MRRLLAVWASIALSAVAANAGAPPQAPATPGPVVRPPAPAPQVPLVAVLEERGVISASVPAGADAAVLRSFRLSTTRTTPLPLSFQPSDLKSDDGAILDRGTIRVKEPVALGALPQDYLIEVTGLKRSGLFRGTLEVRSTAVLNVVQKIPVELLVERPTPVGIAAQTPRFAIKRATSCDPLMRLLFFGSLCPTTYHVALTGPADTLKASAASLLLVRPDGSAVSTPTEASWITATDGRASLAIPDKALDPGHYTGRVRVAFGDRADAVDVPVEVDVRWKPWWPLAALILGILIGRWQAYMQRTGNSLIATTDRLGIIRARIEQLPDSLAAGQAAASEGAAEIWRLVELGQAETAAARVALLDRCVDVIERVRALNPTLADPAQGEKVQGIVRDIQTLEPDAAAKKLVELKDLMAQAGGGSPAGGAAIDGAEIWRKIRTVAVLTASRPVQYVVLLLLLAGAGMKLLYLDGGATLGAEPLADILALVTWGLSADVMSRTISSASPAPAKK